MDSSENSKEEDSSENVTDNEVLFVEKTKLQREIALCKEFISEQTTYVKNVFYNVSCSSIKVFHFYDDYGNFD